MGRRRTALLPSLQQPSGRLPERRLDLDALRQLAEEPASRLLPRRRSQSAARRRSAGSGRLGPAGTDAAYEADAPFTLTLPDVAGVARLERSPASTFEVIFGEPEPAPVEVRMDSGRLACPAGSFSARIRQR